MLFAHTMFVCTQKIKLECSDAWFVVQQKTLECRDTAFTNGSSHRFQDLSTSYTSPVQLISSATETYIAPLNPIVVVNIWRIVTANLWRTSLTRTSHGSIGRRDHCYFQFSYHQWCAEKLVSQNLFYCRLHVRQGFVHRLYTPVPFENICELILVFFFRVSG